MLPLKVPLQELPEQPAPDTPLILCGHGASGDRYQAPIPHLAKRFRAIGAGTLALDGPVHGLRQVGPGGRAALADKEDAWSQITQAITRIMENSQ